MGLSGAAGNESSPGFSDLFIQGGLEIFSPGGTIFRLGETADRVYLVRRGWVRVSRLSRDGQELTLAVLGPGEILGEVALLDGRERTAEAVALTEVALAGLTRQQFLRAIVDRPRCALHLIMSLCERLRNADQLAEELSFLDVKERLRRLMARLGADRRDNPLAELTHKELAEMIGASRESVTRALAELRKEQA